MKDEQSIKEYITTAVGYMGNGLENLAKNNIITAEYAKEMFLEICKLFAEQYTRYQDLKLENLNVSTNNIPIK